MGEEDVISFFKYMEFYNEKYFNTLKNNSKIIDKPYEEIKEFVGCYLTNNGCKLILPKIKTIFDILIWIHEYTHALFPDDELEIFPNIMEGYFVEYFVKDIELKQKIIEKTKKEIITSESIPHIVGKKIKLSVIEK